MEKLALFFLIRSGGTLLAGFLGRHLGTELGHLSRDIFVVMLSTAAASLDTVRFTIVDVVARSTVYVGVQIIEGVQADTVGLCKLFTGVRAGGFVGFCATTRRRGRGLAVILVRRARSSADTVFLSIMQVGTFVVYFRVPVIELIKLDIILSAEIDTVIASTNSVVLGTFSTFDQLSDWFISDGASMFVTSNKFEVDFRDGFVTKGSEIVIGISLRSISNIVTVSSALS